MRAAAAGWHAETSFILSQVPRVLSQQDRDPDSGTYGCFDRSHWHFKIRDFSSAVLQQSALSLALLYKLGLPGSPYAGNERVREWAVAGLRFWARMQHRDGSFDEYYPREHGYIPTSFSLYAAAQACRVLGADLPEVKAACLRAARYLGEHEETQALNQEAASLPGLYATHLLTGAPWVAGLAGEKARRFLARQHPEGWFAEYGGADLGYLSTTLDFLVEYHRMSADPEAFEAARRIVEFSQYFVHQDGSVGGQYGSRNTEYFLLSGLVGMAGQVPAARAMLAKLRGRVGTEGCILGALDDRYICHNMLHSVLRAVAQGLEQGDQGEEPSPPLPCDVRHQQYFPGAGLLSLHTGSYHLICGLKKGGVLRLFAGGRETFCDHGYRLCLRPGVVAASNWLREDCQVQVEPGACEVKGAFTQVEPPRITPGRHALLRLGAWVLGRRLIPVLKRRLIFADRRGPARYHRRIQAEAGGLCIEDYLEVAAPLPAIYAADKFSLRHVASSKYFQPDELNPPAPLRWEQRRRVRVRRQVDPPGGGVAIEIEEG